MTAAVTVLVAVVTASMSPRVPSAPPLEGLRGPRVRLVAAVQDLVLEASLPVPASMVTERDLRAPHHDYPASDLMVPVGTPVFAAGPGVVTIHGGPRCGLGVTVRAVDAYRYTSCHLSRISVREGTHVRAGDVLGLSGDTGNARGVPHLHFHIRDASGVYLCPQPLLVAWFEGHDASPSEHRTTDGCSFARAG